MNYKIEFTKKSEKELKKLPRNIQVKILRKINLLSEDPFPRYSKSLQGYSACFRIRESNYRIVYEVNQNKLVIFVIKIGHRKDVYKS